MQKEAKKSEIWRTNGKLFRKNGPAVQIWDDNGSKQVEISVIDGQAISTLANK